MWVTFRVLQPEFSISEICTFCGGTVDCILLEFIKAVWPPGGGAWVAVTQNSVRWLDDHKITRTNRVKHVARTGTIRCAEFWGLSCSDLSALLTPHRHCAELQVETQQEENVVMLLILSVSTMQQLIPEWQANPSNTAVMATCWGTTQITPVVDTIITSRVHLSDIFTLGSCVRQLDWLRPRPPHSYSGGRGGAVNGYFITEDGFSLTHAGAVRDVRHCL
jgi:hypothetical protein